MAEQGIGTLRVLHVINQFCDGAGAEVSLRQFLTSAAGRDIQNGLVVLTDSRNDFRLLDGAGVEIFVPRRPVPGRLRAFRHTSAAIGAFRPDVVHTSLFESDMLGRLAAWRHHVPALSTRVTMPWAAQATASGLGSRLKFAGVRAIDRYLARHATACFHAVASTVALATADALGVPAARFAVVHRGRSAKELGRRTDERHARARASLERQLGRPLQGPMLLAVGREEPAKNHVFLLGVLEELRNRNPDAVLVIAGRHGAASADIDVISRDHRLEDAVVRLGTRNDVPELLSAADAFVFPSIYEGAAGAVIEAMALELPIVASDIPALQELLENGRCGALAPLEDPSGFAAAVDEVLHGGAVVTERVGAARERFEEEYELEGVSRRMVDLYTSVLRARR